MNAQELLVILAHAIVVTESDDVPLESIEVVIEVFRDTEVTTLRPSCAGLTEESKIVLEVV